MALAFGARSPSPDAGLIALTERLSSYGTDASILRPALVHRSYCAEMPGESSNERLEFLGDAVLGLIVTDYLYVHYPELAEGDLARIRSAVVSTEALAPVARSLGVGEALLLGNGEDASGGRKKASLLADALEAIIGALYQGVGFVSTRRFVLDLFVDQIDDAAGVEELGDAKNRLQERVARLGLLAPVYELAEQGPDHAKQFFALVRIGKVTGNGTGPTKKSAERAAAEDALGQLDQSS